MQIILNYKQSESLLEHDVEGNDNEPTKKEAKREKRHCSQVEPVLFPLVGVNPPEWRVLRISFFIHFSQGLDFLPGPLKDEVPNSSVND